MILPDFCPKISLPSYVKPDNVQALFELFFPKEQLEIIVAYINNHVDHLDLYELDEKAENKRLYRWKPMTVNKLCIYLEIRIYIGIYIKNRIKFYQIRKPYFPSHPISELIRLRRFELIHRRFRIIKDPPNKVGFKGVFNRINNKEYL